MLLCSIGGKIQFKNWQGGKRHDLILNLNVLTEYRGTVGGSLIVMGFLAFWLEREKKAFKNNKSVNFSLHLASMTILFLCPV